MWRLRISAPIALGLAVCIGSSFAASEELRFRPLPPIIKAFIEAQKPDLSEFAYISARGAGLYTALSGLIEASPRNDKDKELAHSLLVLGHKYYQVAMVAGIRAKKDPESTKAQVKLLIETYTAMAVKSKQLNNEILSPDILADMDALKEIQPNILALAADIQKQFDASEKAEGK